MYRHRSVYFKPTKRIESIPQLIQIGKLTKQKRKKNVKEFKRNTIEKHNQSIGNTIYSNLV